MQEALPPEAEVGSYITGSKLSGNESTVLGLWEGPPARLLGLPSDQEPQGGSDRGRDLLDGSELARPRGGRLWLQEGSGWLPGDPQSCATVKGAQPRRCLRAYLPPWGFLTSPHPDPDASSHHSVAPRQASGAEPQAPSLGPIPPVPRSDQPGSQGSTTLTPSLWRTLCAEAALSRPAVCKMHVVNMPVARAWSQDQMTWHLRGSFINLNVIPGASSGIVGRRNGRRTGW